MDAMLRRGEDLAQKAQQEKVREVADRLRELLGSAAIEVEEARVLVRGKGMIKRWLIDPSLRFLAGGLR